MPRRWTNGPGDEPKNYLGLLRELNPQAAVGATRRSGRMYLSSGATTQTDPGSPADGPTERHTAPVPADGGRGVHASTTEPPTTFSGGYLSLPGEGTPSRGRAREEVADDVE